MAENEYITKELCRANRKGVIAKCEATAANIRTEAAEMRADHNLIRQELSELRGSVDELKELKTIMEEFIDKSINKFISRASLILAGMTLIITVIQLTLAVITLSR